MVIFFNWEGIDMKIQHCFAFAIAVLLSVMSARTEAANVALHKPVSIQDPAHEIGNVGGWYGGDNTYYLAERDVVTDGVVMAKGAQWDKYTVFWSSPSTTESQLKIVVDLGGLFSLTGVTLQADNNDDYIISYLDASNNWHSLGQISPPDSWGLDLAYLANLTGVTAKQLAISGILGDGHYAVSELMAEGSAVPLPAALPMFGAGLLGLAGLSRRRR